MQRTTGVPLTPAEIDPFDAPSWTSRTGTFDPVDAGAALAALGHMTDEEPDRDPALGLDGRADQIAEYIERETAYVDPLAPPESG